MRFQSYIPKPSFLDRIVSLLWVVVGFGRDGVVALLQFADVVLSKVSAQISPALIMGLFAAILGSALLHSGLHGLDAYFSLMSSVVELENVHRVTLDKAGISQQIALIAPLFIIIGLYLYALSLLGLIRKRAILYLHKIAVAAGLLGCGYILYFIITIPGTLLFYNTADKEIIFDKSAYQTLLVVGVWGWVPCAMLLFWYGVTVAHSRSARYYHQTVDDARWGDRVVHSVRTGGEDPHYKESSRWSTWWHVFIIFILPFLSFRWMEPYEIPKGSGVQAPQVVQVVKQKKKKQDKMIFNPNSAISFVRPDIDESKILEEVSVETEAQYQETSSAEGKLGQGGGKKGGWPNGMENAKVRFIRLEYAGGNWDQSMGGGADYNFLLKFKELTGFNIAKETESIRISDLRRFPKGKGPPFVYLTGGNHRSGFNGISVTGGDIATLRWYLTEEGGMIFADNGGDGFDSSFRQLMRRVLPNSTWIDIANDDIIYRQPYLFSNGAPLIQSHSGTRGLGIKNEDRRWQVFYHQGDLKDAWKDGGSGFSESVQMSSFKMGINVVNYAFNQYLDIHHGH